MANLEKRIAQLEGARAVANLKAMTNDELIAYADTLESGSPGWYEAIIARVMRNPNNSFKVVAHDLAHDE
jgi:isopropylmalate/homocitrate/citramalate synthase